MESFEEDNRLEAIRISFFWYTTVAYYRGALKMFQWDVNDRLTFYEREGRLRAPETVRNLSTSQVRCCSKDDILFHKVAYCWMHFRDASSCLRFALSDQLRLICVNFTPKHQSIDIKAVIHHLFCMIVS